MKFIIGKKQEMTQLWRDDKVVAVTLVKAEPNVIVQVKDLATDGYSALQMGFGVRKEKNIRKPQLGHMKDLGRFAKLREFRIDGLEAKKGDLVSVDTFQEGDIIRVTANSKGRGFQGVVKRHGFAGQVKTHGTKDQVRMPGSVGAKGPAHIFKGTKMGGRMGGKRITTSNLEIIKVDVENNILYIKGAVPGARNGMVMISGEGELKLIEKKLIVNEEEVNKTNLDTPVPEELKPSEEEVTETKEVSNKEVSPVEIKAEENENIEEVVIEAGKKIE
jgi:large subunit ribosomal protein L3